MHDYPEKIQAAIDEETVLLSFLFHIGNTHTDEGGQVGTCVRVIARTPEEAVKKVRKALQRQSAENKIGYEPTGDADVEYIANYYNPEAVSEADLIKSETQIYDVVQQEEAMKGAYG